MFVGGEKWLLLLRGIQECTHTTALFCYCRVWINRMQLVWRRHVQPLSFSLIAEIRLWLSNLRCEGGEGGRVCNFWQNFFPLKFGLSEKSYFTDFNFCSCKLPVIISMHLLPEYVFSHSSCVTDFTSFFWPKCSLLFWCGGFFQCKPAIQKGRRAWYSRFIDCLYFQILQRQVLICVRF